MLKIDAFAELFWLNMFRSRRGKKAFNIIFEMIANSIIDPHLALLVILPDAVHVEQGFVNWMLVLGNERGCLEILKTLRSPATLQVS